ncbi:MAG: 4Fe-4S binding protein [Candidatus Omnitrophica bacterium]|nr:4Fe-4S binding protein [Candidatus Omnitrophota bacterium]MBU1870083.1 4Fe-4S binding protein [Candidatus Omnitrophota bacterium]
MRYPKLRELREAIKALIKGPYTSDYPNKPHIPFERFRGRPYFHEEDCVGCGACAQVCPAKAIEFEDLVHDGIAKRKFTFRWDVCIACGQCQANCLTEKGIVLSQEFDLASTEGRLDMKQEIEKEFIVCECCGEPVVPFDQYAWVAKKLGPLVFSSSSVMLFYLRALDLSAKQRISPAKVSESARADRIKILCPRCRREAVLKS